MNDGELLERLTEVFGGAGRGVGVIIEAVLDDDGGKALRSATDALFAERLAALEEADDEFAESSRPTRNALDVIMREQKKLYDERLRAAEADAARRSSSLFNEYRNAIAPAAAERDVALKRAQARLERRTEKINAEFSGRIARARALAVLGMRKEDGQA